MLSDLGAAACTAQARGSFAPRRRWGEADRVAVGLAYPNARRVVDRYESEGAASAKSTARGNPPLKPQVRGWLAVSPDEFDDARCPAPRTARRTPRPRCHRAVGSRTSTSLQRSRTELICSRQWISAQSMAPTWSGAFKAMLARAHVSAARPGQTCSGLRRYSPCVRARRTRQQRCCCPAGQCRTASRSLDSMRAGGTVCPSQPHRLRPARSYSPPCSCCARPR